MQDVADGRGVMEDFLGGNVTLEKLTQAFRPVFLFLGEGGCINPWYSSNLTILKENEIEKF